MNDKAASFEATPFDGDDAIWRVVTATRLSGRGGSLHTIPASLLPLDNPASLLPLDNPATPCNPATPSDSLHLRRLPLLLPTSSIPHRLKWRRRHRALNMTINLNIFTQDLYKIKCYIVKQSIGLKLSMRTGYRTSKHSASRTVEHCQSTVLGPVEDLDRCSRYSWGLALLAGLYSGLCEASQYTMHDATGCLYLLQVWAYERIERIAPQRKGVDYLLDETAPLAQRDQLTSLRVEDGTPRYVWERRGEVLNNIRVSTERFREKREDDNLLDEELDKHLDDIINQTHDALTLAQMMRWRWMIPKSG
ncbi:OLC1v1009143C1 [Oldenlandia corymbosa var. corymbosa]|uniref:OLC1v1009143C1 n=1 Tax=Oldenlandia corymbosa var. corymbosa TaxID=529605 RepID=A0AAV1DNS7_OLDCO|nr:OLC1v1009143C1 [Oldenlandia corymbosa var. corymbosa]